MNSHRRAIILLLIATLAWSTSGLFIKLSHWHPLGLNSARSILAALVVWVGVGRPPIKLTKPLLIGAAGFALTTITFTIANRLTTAANAVFLQYSAPLWVALFSIWLLKEYPKRRDWLMMGAIFVGMILFFQADLSSEGLLGSLLSVFSGMCLATMLISLRAQRESGAAETLIVGNLIAFFVGLYWIPGNEMTLREVSIIGYLGIVQLGLPFILLTMAIKELTAVETVLIQTLEPILNPIWVAFVIAEFPSPIAIVGALIVLTAVAANVLFEQPHIRSSPPKTKQ